MSEGWAGLMEGCLVEGLDRVGVGYRGGASGTSSANRKRLSQPCLDRDLTETETEHVPTETSAGRAQANSAGPH